MSVGVTSGPRTSADPQGAAWSPGRKSPLTSAGTSLPSVGGRSAKGCPSTASSTAGSGQSTPTP
jgi:hypothetical protein